MRKSSISLPCNASGNQLQIFKDEMRVLFSDPNDYELPGKKKILTYHGGVTSELGIVMKEPLEAEVEVTPHAIEMGYYQIIPSEKIQLLFDLIGPFDSGRPRIELIPWSIPFDL
jgi:hypothetical protein